MTRSDSPDWQAMCRQQGIEPDEVRLVFARYEAYRRFMGQGAGASGGAISLDRWFRFYYREKTSEGIQAGTPVGGCSADGDAVNNACLRKPAEFLRVLIAYGKAGGASG